MTFKAFLTAFPQTNRAYHTGGGCMAWRIEMSNGWHILVTSPNDACLPEPRDRRVGVGMYGDNGEYWDDEQPVLTWKDAIAWVRHRLVCADALFAATIKLYHVLADLETDIVLARRGTALRALWDTKHTLLEKFFDVEVYRRAIAPTPDDVRIAGMGVRRDYR